MPKGWRPPRPYSYSDDYSYSIEDRSKPANIQENALALSGDFIFLTPEGSQIFISYAREDERAALRLYDDLKDAGLDPWIDKKKLLPGGRWQIEIRKAIRNSPYFIPLFSSNSVNKIGYVQNEFGFALDTFRLNEDVVEFKPYYFPVRLGDCQVPHDQLKKAQILDLFPYEKNWKEGVEMIVQQISKDINSKKMLTELTDKAGELFFIQDKYDEAIEYLDKALEITSNKLHKLGIMIGKANLLIQLERYHECIKFIDMCLKDVSTFTRSWGLWLEKGKALYSLGRYHEAIECYNRSLELEPIAVEAWHRKGLALKALGQYHSANECFDKAKELGYREE